MFRLLASILFLILFTFSVYARDDFGFVLGGYSKNIAKDIHDNLGTVYNKDQKDNSNLLGFGYGSYLENIPQSYRLSLEVEFAWVWGAKIKYLDGSTLAPSTKSTLINLMYEKHINDQFYVKLGGGIGSSLTEVETNYNDGTNTFKGTKNNSMKFSYMYTAGLGMDLGKNNFIDLLYRHQNNGKVLGGSGTTNTGSAYSSDIFDNIVNSYIIQYRFKY